MPPQTPRTAQTYPSYPTSICPICSALSLPWPNAWHRMRRCCAALFSPNVFHGNGAQKIQRGATKKCRKHKSQIALAAAIRLPCCLVVLRHVACGPDATDCQLPAAKCSKQQELLLMLLPLVFLEFRSNIATPSSTSCCVLCLALLGLPEKLVLISAPLLFLLF